MLVTGARLTALEEEAPVPHTEMARRGVMCAERFIIKLSTGTPGLQKVLKIRHNLETIFRAKKECNIM